jgi:N-methylhydantoinase A
MRFAVDTGGTFTDLIVEDDDGTMSMYKAPTTSADPIRGVLDALEDAARDRGASREDMLGRGDTFIYGTTHAINAIITGNVARTALLTTKGHPDILVLREGGRIEPFNHTVPHPEPYVPRSMTWEVPGRLRADGTELMRFDDSAVLKIIAEMKTARVEAIAVCLLWSIVNPSHEERIGELIERHWPGVHYTLSHKLNPTLREYRRASSTCLDASLKPTMAAYMTNLESRLRDEGFDGRVLVVTSQGGVLDAHEVAKTPIHLLNSGPSMAPVSGRYFATLDEGSNTAIIADTGGTTYDVSLVRRGQIPWTRETWIGQPFRGHMTGFPSVDVKSIGAGGGSIAWVDDGGMVHVGPKSAGALPGPACYGQGGTMPTVTDAALIVGYIDPKFFLGGTMKLDIAAAEAAIDKHLARPLGLGLEDAASAILTIATENMVQAILDITVNQGIDPRGAVLVGGGGAAGLNSVLIARRLESSRLIIPEVGAALSAAGALMSDLTAQYRATLYTHSSHFDFDRVNATLAALDRNAEEFIKGPGLGSRDHEIKFWAEARYPEQVWEIEVALPTRRFRDASEVEALIKAFHLAHEEIFAIKDTNSAIEVIGWSAFVSCRIRDHSKVSLALAAKTDGVAGSRKAYFPGHGAVDTKILRFETMRVGEQVIGPAIVESSFTSVVINPGARAECRASGSLSIDPGKE